MGNVATEGIECDQRTLQAMKFRIVKMERDNVKEQKLDNAKMVKEIIRIIEEEAEKK